jgi:glycerol-3-phosphate dehydrogenase subunit B
VQTQVLIIGAGITGTGLARDLALRGIPSIVVDQGDFNSGASGSNHSLLHSGARSVAADPESAAECRRESVLLKRLAPHCVEESGGLFVAVQGDEERYIADFPGLCSECGIEARQNRVPCLLLDIQGMKDFDAEGMLAALGESWPVARSGSLVLPDSMRGRGSQPLLLARSLENADNLEELARSLRDRLRKGEAAGLPAVLGVHDPEGVRGRLQEMVGAQAFEIPTLPNPVPGARLREALHAALRVWETIRILIPGRVLRARMQGGNGFLLETDRKEPEGLIRSAAVVLATGRLLGQGLKGEREGIGEPLFRLPVAQPGTRSTWHRADLFDARELGVGSTGIETDAWFRSVYSQGRRVENGFYAAGSILAHADWMRFKCWAGCARRAPGGPRKGSLPPWSALCGKRRPAANEPASCGGRRPGQVRAA